ncbi:hypothetical protein [Butyrivibrio proteoclasticus]|uniref:hypothetical protein n=1 Tax=Butyrivibrio proteoclasticus TaxID=43305 RepID=UPI00047D2B97|nr:hypothetical protein [Butyrivibrio proteoclasticus]
MNKRSKTILAVLGVLLVFLLAMNVLVGAVHVEEPEQVVFPQGELQDSVFVAQNNEYVENESLSNTYSFESVPYMVDVPAGNGAKIGSGMIYQLSNGYFAYVAEYTDQYDVQDIIASQFPAALLINYVPERTLITTEVDKVGYINGFKSEYVADSLYVTDGVANQQATVLGYALDVPEGVYFGNHLFVAVGTVNRTTDAADTCASVLSAIIKTVRYDEKLDKSLTEAREAAQQEILAKQEEEAAALASAEASSTDGSDMSLAIVGDEVTESVPIVVPSDYENFVLYVDWTMANPNAVLELFFPDGQSYCTPIEQTEYGVKFSLTSATQGTYSLRIMNYQQCGDIATTISGDPVEQ